MMSQHCSLCTLLKFSFVFFCIFRSFERSLWIVKKRLTKCSLRIRKTLKIEPSPKFTQSNVCSYLFFNVQKLRMQVSDSTWNLKRHNDAVDRQTWNDLMKVHSRFRIPSKRFSSFTRRMTRKSRNNVMDTLMFSESWRAHRWTSETFTQHHHRLTNADKHDESKTYGYDLHGVHFLKREKTDLLCYCCWMVMAYNVHRDVCGYLQNIQWDSTIHPEPREPPEKKRKDQCEAPPRTPRDLYFIMMWN